MGGHVKDMYHLPICSPQWFLRNISYMGILGLIYRGLLTILRKLLLQDFVIFLSGQQNIVLHVENYINILKR